MSHKLCGISYGSFGNHSKRLSPAMSENDALQHNPCLTEEGIGKCKPNYVFKNNVKLTSDTDEFKTELDKIVKESFQILLIVLGPHRPTLRSGTPWSD